ncbi:MAG: hypothetical protein VX916_07635, partial [Planctomycetota bacterium]|nr:hypothetical protein [Planctomycetota bacterium]
MVRATPLIHVGTVAFIGLAMEVVQKPFHFVSDLMLVETVERVDASFEAFDDPFPLFAALSVFFMELIIVFVVVSIPVFVVVSIPVFFMESILVFVMVPVRSEGHVLLACLLLEAFHLCPDF